MLLSKSMDLLQLDVLQESTMLPVGQVTWDSVTDCCWQDQITSFVTTYHGNYFSFYPGSLWLQILVCPSPLTETVWWTKSGPVNYNVSWISWVYTHFCDSVPCNIQATNPLKRGTVRILEWRSTNFTVVSKVLHSNYRSLNLIGPYHFWGISPRNLTLFIRPFLHNVWNCVLLNQYIGVQFHLPINSGFWTESINK